MSFYLFIDDERDPPYDGNVWVVARDWLGVQQAIYRHGTPDYVSFDHDLGDHTHSGFDITKMLVDLDMNPEEEFAFRANFDFYVHSQNPIGKANIEHYLNNYLKFANVKERV